MDHYSDDNASFPSDIDFEELLLSAEQTATHDRLFKELSERINSTINSGLNTYAVPSIVDASGMPRTQQISALHEEFASYLQEEQAGFNEEEQAELFKFQFAMKSSEELGLFTRIAIHTTAFMEQPLTMERTAKLNEGKAQIMAEWAVQRDLLYSSEWISFLNSTMLGDTVTEARLQEAMIKVLDEKEQKEVDSLMHDMARAVAQDASGLKAFLKEKPELELGLYMLALQSTQYSSPANYEAAQYEQARLLGVSVDAIRTYIDVLLANLE